MGTRKTIINETNTIKAYHPTQADIDNAKTQEELDAIQKQIDTYYKEVRESPKTKVFYASGFK